jgi:hypothetical protein
MTTGSKAGIDKACNSLLAVAEAYRPTIACLCGSTRFMSAFFDVGWALTLEGKIVLSVGVCKHAEDHGGEALGPEVAEALDELHKRKIDLADEVWILNVGGYIGDSTRSELAYAKAHPDRKRIYWLEPDKEEELADLVIRVMDHGNARGHRIAEAIVAKMRFNASRPMKHGGKAY